MFPKFLNLIQLISGYLLSRVVRSAIHWGKPASLSVEPTNCCNLRCPECPSGMNQLTRAKGVMDIDLYKNLVDELAPSLFYLNLSFQGEPYLHPQFTEMVGYAKSKKIFVSSSTNGHFLTPDVARKTVGSGLNRLIISLDGTDAGTYEKYRTGGNFDEVIKGIKEIVRQKKEARSENPRIILQFLLLKHNQHQVKNLREFGKHLGVDKVQLKTAQICDFRKGNPLIPDNPQFSRYKKTGQNPDGRPVYEIRNRLPNHCFRMWNSGVVTWDGSVVPCCFDKDAANSMGSLNRQSFSEIWKNDAYREFRSKILSSRKSIDICTNCTEGIGLTFFL
ncbi:MAG: radical SAM/SPASM domain-containing protein [Bacteroidetes bacterium]|nr:radical SAM/SPASM domain-containing protein [Bacteroidota bacterium]